jgi:hypothetical protein
MTVEVPHKATSTMSSIGDICKLARIKDYYYLPSPFAADEDDTFAILETAACLLSNATL